MSGNSSPDAMLFPTPNPMRRADGSARFCYATFMILNDSYLPGALTMAYSLRRIGTEADVICLVSEQVSQSAYGVLAQVLVTGAELRAFCCFLGIPKFGDL